MADINSHLQNGVYGYNFAPSKEEILSLQHGFKLTEIESFDSILNDMSYDRYDTFKKLSLNSITLLRFMSYVECLYEVSPFDIDVDLYNTLTSPHNLKNILKKL